METDVARTPLQLQSKEKTLYMNRKDLSKEQKALSVAKIEFPEAFDNDRLKHGGVMDPRLGTVDYQFKCATCGSDSADCAGHFGHIELGKPVFHIGIIIYPLLSII